MIIIHLNMLNTVSSMQQISLLEMLALSAAFRYVSK
jgi:hypothetical protein